MAGRADAPRRQVAPNAGRQGAGEGRVSCRTRRPARCLDARPGRPPYRVIPVFHGWAPGGGGPQSHAQRFQFF